MLAIVLAVATSQAPAAWSVAGPDRHVILTRVASAPLPPGELAALDKRVAALKAARGKAKPSAEETVLAAQLKAKAGPRLTLKNEQGAEIWSIDGTGLPAALGVLSADGQTVLLADLFVEKEPGARAVFAVLGDRGQLVRAYSLDALVDAKSRPLLPMMSGLIAWCGGVTLADGVATVSIRQSPMPPPKGVPLVEIHRSVDVKTGAFVD